MSVAVVMIMVAGVVVVAVAVVPAVLVVVVTVVVSPHPSLNFTHPQPSALLFHWLMPSQWVARRSLGGGASCQKGNGLLSFVLIIIVTAIMLRQTHTLLAVTTMKRSH